MTIEANTGLIPVAPGQFSEEEMSLILKAIRQTIDVPTRKSEPAPKTILIDLFGTPNSGKTKTTEKLELVFRRHKLNVFCPPETAEIAEIRNKSSDNPIVFQARHLAAVQHYVLNLAFERNFHVAIISRGLIDMLFWYEKGLRDGLYGQSHTESVNNQIYELLRLNIVDAFLFFTCSTEAALKREYAESVTQIRGSKMTESFLRETEEIYRTVLERVKENVPELPIFHVDTTNLGVKETTQEVLRVLLPTLQARFSVPESGYVPYSLSLMDKKAVEASHFEEQLKLRDWPSQKSLAAAGWIFAGESEQTDTYLNPRPGQKDSEGFFGEILRIREEGGHLKLMYKGAARDRVFSHRVPLSIKISEEDAKSIRAFYPELIQTKKLRTRFRLEHKSSDGDIVFTLHLDEVRGLSLFTEIRVRGNPEKTHTEELLHLATELGFSPKDIVEGSYLALFLRNRK